MTMRIFNRVLVVLLVIMTTFGCSKNNAPAAKETVERALKQSGFNAVSVAKSDDALATGREAMKLRKQTKLMTRMAPELGFESSLHAK